ncbi:MAG: polysaccharide biosynthesis/export family protein [Bacteroidia bacterium]
MFKRTIILFSVVAFICSCTSQKKLIYFQEPSATNKSDSTKTNTESSVEDFELKIYTQDILTIQLFTINPDAMPGISTSIDKAVIDNRSSYEKGFIVDRNGNIDLPLLGSVHVAGMTLRVAKDTLINRFKQYVDEPVVVLKKLSFKITILGEVNKPGLYYIPSEKMTFAEAFGMAGDLTVFGDRTVIKVYRKDDSGRANEFNIDLTKTDVLAPANMYVHQDDVIFIRAVKRKALANVNSGLIVFTSIISTTVITLALILRLNN